MRHKTAVVVSGGGMKCAYSGGALVALGEKMGIAAPDIVVASSGGVGNAFYYLAGQYADIRKAWSRYLPSPDMIRYFPFPKIRVDYLVDEIFKKLLPLDIEALAASSTRYSIPVTDIDTGRTEFVDKSTWLDPLEVARASAAIPIVFGRKIRLGGKKYVDGDLTTDPQDLVRQAALLGAQRILLITNEHGASPFERQLIETYTLTKRPAFRAAVDFAVEHDRPSAHAAPGAELVIVAPTSPLTVSSITRNRRRIMETFAMGEDDLLAKRAEIEHLFTT